MEVLIVILIATVAVTSFMAVNSNMLKKSAQRGEEYAQKRILTLEKSLNAVEDDYIRTVAMVSQNLDMATKTINEQRTKMNSYEDISDGMQSSPPNQLELELDGGSEGEGGETP